MAMNFLKFVSGGQSQSQSNESAYFDGRGDTSATARSKPKRILTQQETEVLNQVHFLLAKMETLTLPEDRRNNMEALTQLIRDHPDLPIDANGLRTLMLLSRSIQADRHSSANIDLSLQAVEMLKLLLTPHGQNAAQADGGDEANAASATAAANSPLISLFVQNPSYITSLLELLEEKNSVLRLYTIQCLTSLLMVRPEKIQSIVLNHPMGVIVLVELLSDHSEVIRNETLLLLEALTRSNQAIQKIVAFNGAFDKLLTIAEEELSSNGGIIAEDAMRLITSLLEENTSNQFLFLEQDCVRRLIPYLTFKESDLAEEAGAQFEFLGLTLEILNHLTKCLDYNNPAAAQKNISTRNALSSLVHPLLSLCLLHPPPLTVRLEAWSLLSIIIEGSLRNQSLLEEHKIEGRTQKQVQQPASQQQQQLQHPGYPYDPVHNPYIPTPVTTVMKWVKLKRNTMKLLLEMSCDSEDVSERHGLLNLLRVYFTSNPDGQLKAAMSFAPSPMMRAGERGLRQGENGTGEQHEQIEVEEEETGPALGPVLLSMLSGARSPASSAPFVPGPEGSSYIDRTRWIASKPGVPSQTKLLDHYVGALFASQNHGGCEVGLLVLLDQWSDGGMELNELIFSRYSSNLLAYLVQMSRDQNVLPIARGLATYYIALVLELVANPPQPMMQGGGKAKHGAVTAGVTPFSSPIITSAVLLELVTQQISLDIFKTNLASLANSEEFKRAEALTNSRLANPLDLARKAENDLSQRAITSGSAAPEQAMIDATVAQALYTSSALSFGFVTRCKQVQDRCDQRLLSLFTSASAAPNMAVLAGGAASSTLTIPQGNQQSISPLHAAAQVGNRIDTISPLPTAANHDAAATRAMEQELAALREENKRLKQEQEVLKAASSGSDVTAHIQRLQSDLATAQRALAQSQAEVQALKAGGARPQPPHAPNANASAAASSAEVAELRAALEELEAEHKDLLILLASQEIELENARKVPAPGVISPDAKGNGVVRPPSLQTTPTPTSGAIQTFPTAAKPQQNGGSDAHDLDLR